jgi:hypothetical protein
MMFAFINYKDQDTQMGCLEKYLDLKGCIKRNFMICTGIVTQKVTVAWTYASDGENKKYVQNFDGEVCWKVATWKTEKEMGV